MGLVMMQKDVPAKEEARKAKAKDSTARAKERDLTARAKERDTTRDTAKARARDTTRDTARVRDTVVQANISREKDREFHLWKMNGGGNVRHGISSKHRMFRNRPPMQERLRASSLG